MQDKDKIIEELKAENVEIKTSYINFIAKLKREMITKDDIQDLKNTAKKFVEERNSLRFENERLKEELATYGATGVCEVCSDKASKLADKYLGCLQEIKAIAKDTIDCKQYEINHDCFNDTRCKALREFIETLQEIIALITKAEEE